MTIEIKKQVVTAKARELDANWGLNEFGGIWYMKPFRYVDPIEGVDPIVINGEEWHTIQSWDTKLSDWLEQQDETQWQYKGSGHFNICNKLYLIMVLMWDK